MNPDAPLPDSPPAVPLPESPPAVPRWSGWTPPDERRAITVSGVLGEAWQTYRRGFGPLVLIGAVLGLLVVLLGLPNEIYLVRMVDSMFHLFLDADLPDRIYDPILLRSQLQAITQMPAGLAVVIAVAGGASIGLSLLGTCVLTAAALTARAGRRVSPPLAVGAVLSHGSALITPAIVLALGSIAVTLPIELSSRDIQDAQLSASSGGISGSGWLTIASVLVAVAAFYLSVRWCVAIPAILSERIGLRAGLRRSGHLTRGHRLRLGLAFIVVGVLQALTVGLPSLVVGVVLAVGAGSAAVGIAAFAAVAVVGNALWTPVGAAIAAVAYGTLIEDAARSTPAT